jgi:hypothetical protein
MILFRVTDWLCDLIAEIYVYLEWKLKYGGYKDE